MYGAVSWAGSVCVAVPGGFLTIESVLGTFNYFGFCCHAFWEVRRLTEGAFKDFSGNFKRFSFRAPGRFSGSSYSSLLTQVEPSNYSFLGLT